MPNFVANHIVSLVSIVLIVMFIQAILGYMNTELLEVLKAVAIAQQNNS